VSAAYALRLRWERLRLTASENIIRFGQWVGG
jgi:hypothetical protein